MKKLLTVFIVLVLCLGVLAVCRNNTDTPSSQKDNNTKEHEAISNDKKDTKDNEDTDSSSKKSKLLSGTYEIEIDIKDYGVISVELDADAAPITVTNFINLVKDKFYDGLTFHRIISGFMIQGGDPLGNGTGGSDNNIKGEFSSNGVENNISHTRGTISMARSNDPNSASSQFFIMHQDSPHLDGDYAAFGHVTDGIEIVDKICEDTPVQDGNGTVAQDDQPTITSIKIKDEKDANSSSKKSKLLSGIHQVEIDIKDYGVISVELDADTAPITVTNFINLVKDKFYDGLTFHRIISGFMIQGGDPLGNGTGGSDNNIKGEFSSNGVENNISHTRGTISMARSSDPNSASSQFFIMHQDSPHLDGDYAAFGHVTDGIEIVDKICEDIPVQDNNGTVAQDDQPTITSIKIVE